MKVYSLSHCLTPRISEETPFYPHLLNRSFLGSKYCFPNEQFSWISVFKELVALSSMTRNLKQSKTWFWLRSTLGSYVAAWSRGFFYRSSWPWKASSRRDPWPHHLLDPMQSLRNIRALQFYPNQFGQVLEITKEIESNRSHPPLLNLLDSFWLKLVSIFK